MSRHSIGALTACFKWLFVYGEKNKLVSKVPVIYVSSLIAFVLSLLLKDIEIYNQVGARALSLYLFDQPVAIVIG